MSDAPHSSEADARAALRAAGIGVWAFNAGSGELSWDARVREVVEAEVGVEPNWTDHFLPAVHPDDLDRVQTAFAAALSGSTLPLQVEFRVIGRKSGRVTWAALTGSVDPASLGLGITGPRLIGTARDITAERTRFAEALADRRVWADIVEGWTDPIVAVNTDLVFIALNQAYVDACERLFGRRFRLGEQLTEVLDHMAASRDAAVSMWLRALNGRAFDVRTGNLDTGIYENRFHPLRDGAGVIVGAYQTSRDVTARVTAEEALKTTSEALQRAQKMEAIGNLTGGIAHDFNNLLQVVSGNLQLLAPMVRGDSKAERRIDNAMMGVDRGAKLAAQLLAFGRRQPLEPRVTHIGRLIEALDELLHRALGEEIDVVTAIAPDLWHTLVDPAQVENALLNLSINGRDAMQGRGMLTIEVANATLDEDYAARRAEVTAGDYVMIAVSDTGSGMDPALIERVFEPFFSTKPEGHGTGLGLSMVHGFVKQSSGHVEIYSEVGHGTTVKLYLPRAEGEADPRAEPSRGEAARGDATILVAEDDAQVRETAVALLTDLGYRVIAAVNADEALGIVESGAAIDLIFTDVIMPGLVRGLDMARRAKARLPHLAVLFTSGYPREAVVHGGRLDAGVELLPKPYTREALATRVAALLAAHR